METPELFSVGGRLAQGLGGLQAGNAQAKILRAQARETANVGAAQELRVRAQARRQIGQQVAAQFSNGFQGGSGSALDYLMESQVNAELDAMEVRRQASSKTRALESEAGLRQWQGQSALLEGMLGAYGAGSGMIDDWAQVRRGVVGGAV